MNDDGGSRPAPPQQALRTATGASTASPSYVDPTRTAVLRLRPRTDADHAAFGRHPPNGANSILRSGDGRRSAPSTTSTTTAGGEAARERQRVSWDGAVVEHGSQRVSKCCCVFQKKKLFGESSSDSSSSSSSDSSDDEGASADGHGRALPSGGGDGRLCCHHHRGDGDERPAEEGREGDAHAEKAHKHKKPRCTKEHCYCDTRFH
ncbi:hypothetical protein STCU_10207 [Strigomonas culicis]|uniref:Protein phosphatase inhibitor n=1 Tax=Strigomonas culicis TaxID=28005 RepID=S9V5D8_9TRYP|nr:hypothetical protein STCU_10207 [Strigomonas culicis]|eukprot:EPY18085.1 hypothetical protein STCU_10207 [Strigomonas culicis]